MGVDNKKGGCLHDLGAAIKKKHLYNYKQLCRYKKNETVLFCFAQFVQWSKLNCKFLSNFAMQFNVVSSMLWL